MTADGSLAHPTYRVVEGAPDPADRLTEFFIHAYGPATDDLPALRHPADGRLATPGLDRPQRSDTYSSPSSGHQP
ncbi:hypothetical protein ACFYXM_19095 [Streptomyces sp. NPDC002476]|uniref:hypothetical protein n=1 Tax=Streptomyces sp. NPDC002476 TaxID=3364648 RepID=UPI0036856C61